VRATQIFLTKAGSPGLDRHPRTVVIQSEHVSFVFWLSQLALAEPV
jgi:hypothetical protein